MKLGINTGFALNRFPRPEQWLKIVGKDLGLKYVQLTADLLNPSWGEAIVNDYIDRINALKITYNVEIDSVMTGAFTRVNHFSHPDPHVRRYWINWFKQLADITKRLGATNLSSHFGIMSHEDVNDPIKREQATSLTVAAWKEIAEYGKQIGLQYLSWEPMSVKREYGETIAETERIQKLLQGSAIPILICLDVSHGDLSSQNPDDHDYAKWVEKFAAISPLIHLKQVMAGTSAHLPFTTENNMKGKIRPETLLPMLEKYGAKNALLLLELAFREREPTESLILQQLQESADYWKRGMNNHGINL